MKAIDFTLPANNGENVKLSDFLGKRVVLYFYPKDNTPGCTQEACNFRDNFERLTAKNVVVLGVSKDSIKKHEGFVAKQKLPFLLLSDENSDVCEKYGVWNEKINFGKKYFGIIRSTFLIDEKGEIIKEWRKVKVEGHVDEIIEELDK
ncbi:MAG: thioredoxin-dependent thiol peroxidase [Leptotrichiaceae bacterium]|jgi:peroxiredoxin Q/BCP|nr:thioredoxin-dependent thiol peroxidase [Leptotrichiaceae bacterium]MBP6167777.1 thioredoxin-dependent thiol peroxidase [Leptotrichiaceae bacterium]MBP7025712.1 thioredoxin-dependent thiol peroxidase [Leptotrichiaceae bacterium]MBP8636469.1 thioredoxin-dependent thiol peroxidase [Leptotrichiaceae bacterium]MBP9538312.1 thioredoxin-dependent thiol peroxidase [Leptotrichiaceae bacterium]